MLDDWLILLLPLFLIAALYGAVGHGGASGYLAIMALAATPALVMKPTALSLNIAVSLVGTLLFFRAGHFAWRLFWPFAVASIPLAYLGGGTAVTPQTFNILLAVALSFAALRLLWNPSDSESLKQPALWAVLLLGASIGWFSGLIGVGGGIFLTPLLLIFRWADAKTAAAVSAPFIFVNSAAGLIGNRAHWQELPEVLPLLAVTVVAGGFLGARWGSGRALNHQLKLALALVLAIASAKLLLSL
ncbi:MAG: sulfite exporter TauE/SafE family protein [Opitutales bacterium]|nr:sulfite exporter TauE/SafE family protein [Opitutales bacterium]